jgi:ribonuclease P protein component
MRFLKKKHIYNFRKCCRINKSKCILSLLKTGTKWNCPHTKIFYCKNNLKINRLGILLSNEIGTSCLRNTIKRTIKEIFRRKTYNLEPHCDVLIKIFSKKDLIKKRTIEEALFSWYKYIKR